MLTIEIVSHQGKPDAASRRVRFGPDGGCIGRDPECLLSLPDPHRHMSRRHARVSCADEGYRIENISAGNFLIVNGSNLPPRESCPLAAGDRIYLGHYLLAVTAADDGAAEVSGTPPAPVVGQAPVAGADDCLGAAPMMPPAAAPTDPLIQPGALALAGIKAEYRADPGADPFILPSLGARNAPDALFEQARQLSLRDLGGDDKSVDALYLESCPSMPARDPLASPPESLVRSGIETSRSLDPLALFGDAPDLLQALAFPAGAAAVPDHADRLAMHLDLPRPAVAGSSTQDAPAAGAGAGQPPPPALACAAAAAAPSGPAAAPPGSLLQAFLEGAGLPQDLISQPLTPDFMRTLGTVLLTAMQGTVDLINARSVTKREVKAELTLILPAHNNPLKFVPDGRAALIHIFGKQIPGFSGPIDAMQDAYHDLRTHQVGIFAGMRAALAEVLQRFSPDEVEKRVEPAPLVDSILPAHRKARLWDLYGRHFERIYAEAQEDFDIIFGDAFAVAYEAQVRSTRASQEEE